jgi:hypothetical protein
MDDQEQEWFPKDRTARRTKRQEMGACMVALRKTAARSPAQPSALKKVEDASSRDPYSSTNVNLA